MFKTYDCGGASTEEKLRREEKREREKVTEERKIKAHGFARSAKK